MSMLPGEIEADDRPAAGPGPEFTFGIEEEFFLVDPQTRDVIADPDPAIMRQCIRERGPHKVVPELLRSQVETGTRVCRSIADLREALTETRWLVVRAAEAHGARAMAASTHPFASWKDQLVTPEPRYREFETEMQDVARRSFASGMHIHAGFGDSDSRLRVMTAFRRHLPLFIALSASSPFYTGGFTGCRAYRPVLFGAWPRTTIPPAFASQAEFDALVDMYRRVEALRDSSQLWFTVRPSHAYPTIEIRACDICTDIDDAIALAALYASTLRYLLRLDGAGALPPEPPTELIAENCWLAQRYGTLAFLGDFERGGRMDIADSIEVLLAEVAEDARALGCETELRRIDRILREGSGADRQVELYDLLRLDGVGEQEALRAVVDRIVEETRPGPQHLAALPPGPFNWRHGGRAAA